MLPRLIELYLYDFTQFAGDDVNQDGFVHDGEWDGPQQRFER